jgi:hypothetical protein
MTDIPNLLRLASEAGAANEMAIAAKAALMVAGHEIDEQDWQWLRFAIGVARGVKQRGRPDTLARWRPEISEYLDALAPLSLAALQALGEVVG